MIENNVALQNDLMSSILHGYLDEAKGLLRILHNVKHDSKSAGIQSLWNPLVSISKEKKILEYVAKLERGKSSLALYIDSIDRRVQVLAMYDVI